MRASIPGAKADVDLLTGPWRFEPALSAGLALVALLYLRGWRVLHRLAPERWPLWRGLAFVAGVVAVVVATASPLDALADLLLQAHMLQHALLTLVAPPLLLLGAPLTPVLRGVPRSFRKQGLGPFLAWPALQRTARWLVHPAIAWPSFVLTLWVWHLPRLYELALLSPGWHRVEHALFLLTAVQFWFPVIQPWPTRPVWHPAARIPYLLLAALQGTVFSALFAFSSRIFYPAYADAPRMFGVDPLVDQAAAGALMWVLGGLAYGSGLLVATVDALQTRGVRPGAHPERRALAMPEVPFDALRLRFAGAALRSLGVRRALQGGMALLALALILDGLFGPPLASANLAGVLVWTWWRGLLVIALLVAGNVFCMACPFTLPRTLARRLGGARHAWPSALRGKWLAAALLVAFLVGYEFYDPWDVPAWTAAIALGYFAAAFGIDALFEGASFCKYVCPIGQFNFVASSVSPLEVRVRSESTCATCTTRDCIRGGPQGPGCATDLAQPTKHGNLDCTFCMDCVRACPHDNVGLLAARRLELASDAPRSSLGRLSKRPDLAALALVIVFGAFANAAGMVAPVVGWQQDVAARLGAPAPLLGAGLLLVALGFAPFALTGAAALAGASLAARADCWRELSRRLAFALVPLGFAMWLAHFGFHLVTAGSRLVPTLGRLFGAAMPMESMAMEPAAWLLPLEIAALGIGLVATLRVGWQVCGEYADRPARALALGGPWAGLATLLYLAGVWLLYQPMEMRGMPM